MKPWRTNKSFLSVMTLSARDDANDLNERVLIVCIETERWKLWHVFFLAKEGFFSGF